jgi:hypothetical protein
MDNEKKWSNGIVEECKDEKKDGMLGRMVFTQYSSIPTFQLSLGLPNIP